MANFRPVDPRKSPRFSGIKTFMRLPNVKTTEGVEGYLCGSPGMIDASIAVFKNLGMTEDKIYYDKFA